MYTLAHTGVSTYAYVIAGGAAVVSGVAARVATRIRGRRRR
jgi:hypothetical protein